MQSIKLQSHTDEDGVLKLEVPLGASNAQFEVLIVVQPVEAPAKKREWPPGFFERTYGAFAETPLERPPQGEYEVRDELE